MAFEEVCPERIDLIHKNYRKLCNLLIDVEEWGQVVIINMLTRYARTQFLSPTQNVSDETSGGQLMFSAPDKSVLSILNWVILYVAGCIASTCILDLER